MSIDPQNHQAIRGLLENALHQVVTTQTQVTSIEGQLHEIKSQIDLSLESIDSVLQQLEVSERKAEKVRSDVAATLGEMFEHMSRIVNGAREQMLHTHDGEPNTQRPVVVETPTESVIEQEVSETTLPPTIDQTPVIPAEETSPESSQESLSGCEAGQRATASLNEMIATIDETNTPSEAMAETPTETPVETVPETQAVAQPEPETIKREENAMAEQTASEPETLKGPGSADSLSALLAKARAASGTGIAPTSEAAPLVGEEEDAQTVNELLHNTSGSFVAQ